MKDLLKEVVIVICIGTVIMLGMVKCVPTHEEQKEELIKKGFNPHQADSIIDQDRNNMIYYLILAS